MNLHSSVLAAPVRNPTEENMVTIPEKSCQKEGIREECRANVSSSQLGISLNVLPKLGRNPIYFPYNKYQQILHNAALHVIQKNLRTCPRKIARVAVNELRTLCSDEEKVLLPNENAFRTRVLDYIERNLRISVSPNRKSKRKKY